MRGKLVVAVSILLVGCAKPLEVSSVTSIASLTGSAGVDVHESRRISGAPGVPAFAGDQLLEVRTYATTPQSGRVEIAGANCKLSAADFNATMVTPAKVRVPLYRAQSSSLAVMCEKAGFKQRMITVEAMDVTRLGRTSSGAGAGLVGLLAVTAIDAFADNSQNEWAYPAAVVDLERDGVR